MAVADEGGRKLDLFLLKQCAVQLHEVVQSLHSCADRVTCPFCGSDVLSRLAKSKSDKRLGIVVHCKECQKQFMVSDQEEVIRKIVDVILLMGDANVPLPPKRET
jgi:transcription elongation factor Elf1